MATRTRRKKSQLPDCYYEGYLEKMSFRDQTCQKLWTCLCGNTLFGFSGKRDIYYADEVDLTALISVEDDNDPDCEAHSTRFTVHLQSGSLKYIASSPESRELWKGFILSVGQLSVPSTLKLLPGQIHMMADAVQKEKERLANIHPLADCTPKTTQPDLPSCFFEVSRLEAEILLEREAGKGNLLVRPGRSLNSYAISTRMDSTGAVFSHLQVFFDENKGFIINVEESVCGKTLQDLVDHVVTSTKDYFKPLIIEEHYDDKICYFSSDKESGERTLQTLPAFPVALPRKHVNEKLTPEAKPGGERKPSLAEKVCDEEKESRVYSAVAASPAAPPRKILMPPSHLLRKSSSAAPANNRGDYKKLSNVEEQRRLLMPAMSELKLKLEQKAKIQD